MNRQFTQDAPNMKNEPDYDSTLKSDNKMKSAKRKMIAIV